jgi:hypothetical protein
MTLAKGDQLQLKANAPSLGGKELINGELVTVAGVNPKGQIELKDGRTCRKIIGNSCAVTRLRLTARKAKLSNTFCFPIRR